MHISKINNFSDFIELIKNKDEMEKTFIPYAEQLHARTLHIKEVGISGKLLNDWIAAGIVNKMEVLDNKWRFFSISDFVKFLCFRLNPENSTTCGFSL